MTFLLLPSTRLILYQATSRTLKVYPLKGEQLITLTNFTHSKTIISLLKTVNVYDTAELKTIKDISEVKDVVSVSFTKKIDGLAHNNKDTIYVSDKFGDIYSIGLKGEIKYLNSNLGIPTLLSYFSINNKAYIAVGDEDTRIKIYNEARMHQIKSFWFLTKKIPLQLIQTNNQTIVLLIKKQQKINMHAQQNDQFVELHQLHTKLIEQGQYKGQSFYQSAQLENNLQCKYQYIVNRKDKLYLLKLFKTTIKVVTFLFNETNQKYSEDQQIRQVQIKEGDWNYLNAKIDEQLGQLIIIYGKSIELNELQSTDKLYEITVKEENQCIKWSINENQHFVAFKL